MDYRKLIIEFCNGLRLDTVGFTPCRKFEELRLFLEGRKNNGLENEFEEQDIEKRINPFLYMHNGKTIISIAFPYRFQEAEYNCNGFSIYTLGTDYHKVVKAYLDKIIEFIRSLGGSAEGFVDSTALPERHIAVLCGTGFIGKNNMLITKKYGSFVFLGEIITDLEIVEQEGEVPESDKIASITKYYNCGECDKCLRACPTKAINNEMRNSNICLSYITQKKHLEEHWLKKLGGRLFGCDTCQFCCPYNQDAAFSQLEEFRPHEFMVNMDPEELSEMDNRTFKEKVAKTSCGWRGRNVLQRNAMINLMCRKKDVDIKRIKSPYLMDYYDRLLKLFKL